MKSFSVVQETQQLSYGMLMQMNVSKRFMAIIVVYVY